MLDLSWRFDAWFDALPPSPKERGTVARLVLRTGPSQRVTPAEIELVPGRGAEGDAWSRHPHRAPGNEVALMNVHVLSAVCDGDQSRTPLSGDNLHVDLDLGEANLPVGTRLSVGSAILRVSELPHRPCKHFVERFGATAAKRIARANRRGLRGRGVLCTIEQGGRVRLGDPIVVLRSTDLPR
ncbi:MAG TPA: MOSC domain-containing protein [Planctomycetota bacterium]|nr:MOSC domain-containing protein [Planctomycetota bacterium]